MTVGNKPITNYDLKNEIKMLNILSGGKLLNEKNNLINRVGMDSLISRLIKQTEIEKHDFFNFNQKDLDYEVDLISKSIGIGVQDLENIFKSSSIPFSLLIDRIVTDLRWNGLIFNIYKNKITIDNEYITKQLNLIKEKQFIKEYLISEILIDPVPSEKLKDEISKIKNMVNTNGFEKTALEISITGTAANGGKLGWLKETEISEKFKDLIKKTPVGQMSEPLILPEGIMFIKVNENRTVKNKINIENAKTKLVAEEKIKKLNRFSIIHYKKLKNSILITKS